MSADDDLDLDAEFAQFEAQIQNVVSKPKPVLPPASILPSATTDINALVSTTKIATTSTSPAVPTPENTSNTPASSVLTTNNNNASVTGKWKWDGAKWNWVTQLATSPSATPSLTSQARPSPMSTSNAPAYTASQPTTSAPALGSAPPAKKPVKRTAAGDVWKDYSLAEWPENDHRIFVGDLAPDATDDELYAAFSKYPSFNMARVVQDKRSGKCKGYGFVSFAAGEDMIAALREMNGKYVGSRPVKLKKSNWQRRNLDSTKRKELRLLNAIQKKRR